MPTGRTPAPTFFDTKTYPGKRAVRSSALPNPLLECALLADGVAADRLYPLDLDRAFAKIETIKDELVFWEAGSDSETQMASGEVDLIMAWNGRAYAAVADQDAPFAGGSGESLLIYDALVVPDGVANPDEVMKLINFMMRAGAPGQAHHPDPLLPVGQERRADRHPRGSEAVPAGRPIRRWPRARSCKINSGGPSTATRSPTVAVRAGGMTIAAIAGSEGTRRRGTILLLLAAPITLLVLIVGFPLVDLLRQSSSGPAGWGQYRELARSDVVRSVLGRTLATAALVSVVCLVLGYPYAYLMTLAGKGLRALLFVLILLPFWTSFTIRTLAWVVLLQDQGLINDALAASDSPGCR